MADKDNAPGREKITICHFDKDDGEYDEKTIPKKAAERHAKNHANDIIPAPENGCPDNEESETETEPVPESDQSINMDELMEDLTRHETVITEITNSECSLGEVVTGFGPNGELLCTPDDTGEENPINIITRTETADVPSGQRLISEYYCESGEIIIGGLIEMPSMESPLSNDGNMITSTEQSYNIVTGINNTPEPIQVNITWLCFVI